MPFRWSLNPYTGCAHRCTFCYVRALERRADRPADERYGQTVRVKVNIAEALAGARTALSLVTRGPLIVRDIDVLQHAARRAGAEVHVSIPTLDPEVWRRTEPHTAPPLRALRALVHAGIDAGVGLAPILPGISDRPEQLAAVLRAARDAGATRVWCNVLHLRPGPREHFLERLARDWPAELERYARLDRGAYLDRRHVESLQRRVQALGARLGIADRRSAPLGPSAEAEQDPLAL